jgi:hypothetical protein
MRSQTWSRVTEDLNSVAALCTKGAIDAHDGEKSTGKRILFIIAVRHVAITFRSFPVDDGDVPRGRSLAVAGVLTNPLAGLFRNLRQSVFLQMAGVAVELANAFG